MTKSITNAVKVLLLAILLSFGLSYVYAWTAPTATPPAGNVSAPLNISATAQKKAGALTVANNLNVTTGSAYQYNGSNVIRAQTALNNYFFGNAGNLTMTGIQNTASGLNALFSNNTGSYNTATGLYALRYNVDGSENTASGVQALVSNTTGSSNTASGRSALFSNTGGNNNTASGQQALYSNTTGASNTASGFQALRSNTTGSSNTASGVWALYSTTNIGIDDAYGNTAGGLAALYSNTTGDNNTASGVNALFNNTTGVKNTAYGVNSLTNNTWGTNNTAIGYGADMIPGNLTNATAIGSEAIANRSNSARIGNTGVTFIGGNVVWSASSDRRLKKDIIDYTHGLDLITKLRPVEYKLKADTTNKQHSGFIAQEVEAIGVPFYGINKPENESDYYSLAYSEFVVPLVNAVKELKAENDKLKADNDDLQLRIEKIEARLR